MNITMCLREILGMETNPEPKFVDWYEQYLQEVRAGKHRRTRVEFKLPGRTKRAKAS